MKEFYDLIERLDDEIKESHKRMEKSGGLNSSELQRLDLLSHALKSLECVCAMREDDDGDYSYRRSYDNSMNHSGRRMRSKTTGRWYSGDGGNSMDGMNSNRSYGNGQDFAQKLREMATMMEQQQN